MGPVCRLAVRTTLTAACRVAWAAAGIKPARAVVTWLGGWGPAPAVTARAEPTELLDEAPGAEYASQDGRDGAPAQRGVEVVN